MKLHEEFRVAEPVPVVWRFFEQPELVAGCMPGVESVSVIDDDNLNVRATQSIGPLTATFEARVTILDRVPNQLIRFRATGKSVRGAVGNVRATNAVQLLDAGGATTVVVDGDVILAGALGSVGQKIVAKQAGKVTAEFAGNLERALTGVAPPRAPAGTRTPRPAVSRASAGQLVAEPLAPTTRGDPWSKVAAALSGISVVLSVISLVRSGRRGR